MSEPGEKGRLIVPGKIDVMGTRRGRTITFAFPTKLRVAPAPVDGTFEDEGGKFIIDFSDWTNGGSIKPPYRFATATMLPDA